MHCADVGRSLRQLRFFLNLSWELDAPRNPLLLNFAFSLPLVNQCVVPENIHTPPLRRATEIQTGEGVQKEAISEGVGGCLQRFFPGSYPLFYCYWCFKTSIIVCFFFTAYAIVFFNTIVIGLWINLNSGYLAVAFALLRIWFTVIWSCSKPSCHMY